MVCRISSRTSLPPTITDLAPFKYSIGLCPSGAWSNCGSLASAIPTKSNPTEITSSLTRSVNSDVFMINVSFEILIFNGTTDGSPPLYRRIIKLYIY